MHGDKRGRELGMPTANLVPDDAYVCPGHGVYAATAYLTSLPGQRHRGHSGRRQRRRAPDLRDGRGLLVEAHLIGFDDDIYGETLRLAFIERLRGEKRFDSVDELVHQMNADVEQAAAIAERAD